MMERLGLAALRALNPERAHNVALRALSTGLVKLPGPVTSPRLTTTIAGLTLPNPVGLAAGFDKNAEAIAPLCRAGFGFIEVGAATPLPQPGNPKPRLFRLTEDHAAINRFGFNNQGMETIATRLAARPTGIPVGLNLGANKTSADRAADYARVLQTCGAFVDFATVNVSSPNTEKLRDLQGTDALRALLTGVMETRETLDNRPAIFLKIAPDLSRDEITSIGELALSLNLDGVIATNTTLNRDGLRSKHAGEAGGLSGKPLFAKSTAVLAQLYIATEGKIPLIGVGGVDSPETAYAKIKAGASAVQLYTALVYEGLSLIPRIINGLDQSLAAEGYDTLQHAIGSEAAQYAATY